jgi:hypothetical protein
VEKELAWNTALRNPTIDLLSRSLLVYYRNFTSSMTAAWLAIVSRPGRLRVMASGHPF